MHRIDPVATTHTSGTAHHFALLLLRIASAMVFLYHGSAILFGAFGGPGPEKFAAFMHAPAAVGYLVGLEIGRASCRERVEIWVVEVSQKKMIHRGDCCRSRQ